MISLKLTTDKEYIKSIFLNPDITNQMRDDASRDLTGGEFMLGYQILGGFCLKVIKDGADAGLFWLRPLHDGFEAHTALLPLCRGKDAVKAARMAIKWVLDNTETPYISSYAFSDSPSVSWFCRAVGMEPVKTESWSSTRNGKPVSITYFKINRT